METYKVTTTRKQKSIVQYITCSVDFLFQRVGQLCRDREFKSITVQIKDKTIFNYIQY